MKKEITGREAAVEILMSKNDAYGNIALRNALAKSGLDRREKAFITEIVNGVLRNLIFIDYVIDFFSKIKTDKMKPAVLAVLRVSVYQIFFLTNVPQSAVCNEAVEIVKKKGLAGLAGFVNGVLRSVCRKKDDVVYPDKEDYIKYLSTMYSYQEWIVEALAKQYDLDLIERMFSAANSAPDVTLCPNTLRTSLSELAAELDEEGMIVTVSGGALHVKETSDITESKSFTKGYFHVMDESSMLAVRALDPQKGETIFDMCAAPGGKTFYAAYLMENSGKICSFDIHKHKLDLMEDTAKRLGIGNVRFTLRDSTAFDPALGQADRVLLDAPCSGLGVARKKPDVKYMKSAGDIAKLVDLQRKLLETSGRYVKAGGIMVYSTCTLLNAENEWNVRWFIENFPFKLDWQKQIFPDTQSDGFYIAVMRKEL